MRDDPARPHPVEERRHVARDRRGVVAVLAIELPDGRVLRARAGRDQVGNRREVDVDAGPSELASPHRRDVRSCAG